MRIPAHHPRAVQRTTASALPSLANYTTAPIFPANHQHFPPFFHTTNTGISPPSSHQDVGIRPLHTTHQD